MGEGVFHSKITKSRCLFLTLARFAGEGRVRVLCSSSAYFKGGRSQNTEKWSMPICTRSENFVRNNGSTEFQTGGAVMDYFTLYSSYPDHTIAAAWDSQVKEADQSPWLANTLTGCGEELFARFAARYAEL